MSSVTPLLLAAIHLLVPGALIAVAAGAPLLLAVTSAPIVTFGLVTLVSQLTSTTGAPWTPLSFWVAVLGTAALVAVLRRALRGTPLRRRLPWVRVVDDAPRSQRGGASVVLSALAAGALGAGVAVWGMGSLTGINQEFDVLFHVNAVQLISETRSADPAGIGAVNHYEYGSTSYPVAFHALAALPAMLGINAVVAMNALVALIPAVLALGLAGVLWQLRLPRHAVVVPFVAISMAVFPFDLMWRGPVWPFAMGVALIPGFLACLVAAFARRSLGAAVLAAVGAAGVLAVHPSAALAAAVFSAGFFLQRWLSERGAFRADLLPLTGVAIAAVVMALPSVLVALANSSYGVGYDWPAVQTPGAALGEFVTFNYFADYPQIWLFLFLVVGLVAVRRLAAAAWWIACSTVFTGLLVLAAAYEGRWVAIVTGPWWNDRFRFSAIAALGLAVLCAHGLVVAAEWLVAATRRVQISPRVSRSALGLLAVTALFAVLTQGFYAGYNHDRLQQKYAMGSGGSVTPPELEAMEWLAANVEDGVTVMNDPGDGSAWMWALHGVRPMFGQALLTPTRPPLERDVREAIRRFNCIDSSSRVREVVEKYDIGYAYVGDGFIFEHMHRVRGLEALSTVDSLELVFENEGARIYEVDPQPLVEGADDPVCRLAALKGDADEDLTDQEEGSSDGSSVE